MRLKDKVAIVTGAGGGLGKATVLTFVKEGAKVVIDDITNKIYDVQKEAEMLGGEVLPIKADVSKWDQIKNMTEKTLDKWHRIDILVNNAANFGTRKQIIDLEEEEWERTLNVNLKGTFLCCKAVIPIMKEQKYGKIINVASLAGVVVGPRFTGLDYAASKNGVVGLTKALAMQCGQWGINVNVVVPGYMKTPPVLKLRGIEWISKVAERIPIKRFGEPQDIANVILFLASDESSFIHGTTIIVDGGHSLSLDKGAYEK